MCWGRRVHQLRPSEKRGTSQSLGFLFCLRSMDTVVRDPGGGWTGAAWRVAPRSAWELISSAGSGAPRDPSD